MSPSYQYRCKPHRVVDGDTVDLDVDLGFHLTVRIRVRLAGIDTPERGQAGFKEASAFVASWIADVQDGDLVVQTEKTGKYGRWLGVITTTYSDQSLNRALVEAGLAKEF